jgi:hypothetical protein
VKQRIEAVQRVYWAVLGLSLAVIVLGLPLGNDGETMAVLDELTAFDKAFEASRGSIEQSQLTHAKRTGAVALAELHAAIGSDGLPKISIDAAAPAIEPLTAIDLSTLSKIQAQSEADASLNIGSARPAETGEALSWRIARAVENNEKPNDPLTLNGLTLTLRTLDKADVQRELEAATTRRLLRKAEKTLVERQAAFKRRDELYEQRKKWRATWKVLQRTNEERTEAETELAAAQKNRDALAAQYESLAQQADAAIKGAKTDATFAAARGDERYVVATAQLTPRNGKPFTLDVAAPVDIRSVGVPPITGAELPITRSTPLWKEIEGGTSAAAIERVKRDFTWHYAHVQAGPIKLGGMTVIQLAPLVLLPFLLIMIRRSRRVASGYNPFDRDAGALPRVGLGTPLNIVVLIVLPLVGAVLCGVSLVQLRQVPMVPMFCVAGVLGLGITAHISIRDLVDLRDAVRQSHSAPPPAEKAAKG